MRSSTLQGETGKATCKFPSLTAWNFTQCYSFICKFSGLIVKAQTQCIVDCCHCLIFAIKNNLQALKLKSEKKKRIQMPTSQTACWELGNILFTKSRKTCKKKWTEMLYFQEYPVSFAGEFIFLLEEKMIFSAIFVFMPGQEFVVVVREITFPWRFPKSNLIRILSSLPDGVLVINVD